MNYSGKHVVVTGGTGALGEAVVRRLVSQGAVCHVPCYRAEHAEGFSLGVEDGVHLYSAFDLTKEEDVTAFYGPLPALWGSIHVAGGFAMAPLADTSLADFRQMIDRNLVTTFLCCREAVSSIRRGEGKGRVVNVAAKPAVEPVGGMVAYAASKAAVVSLTLSLSEELYGEEIWVNAVVPSVMDTPVNRSAMPGADHDAWPKVSEVAESIAFLASPANQVTRGALVPVYGKT